MATLTAAAQEFVWQPLICWQWQSKIFPQLTHLPLCMQLVEANRAFQHLFYLVILFINACYLTLSRVKENQLQLTDFSLGSILKICKMSWGLRCFYKYNLVITYGYPWHLAKYFPCPLLSTCIKLGGPNRMHLILTQRLGTRLDRLTCRGANIWSCWRQDIAAAWTSESEWSCVIAHPTKQEERIVEIVAPLPNHVRGYP